MNDREKTVAKNNWRLKRNSWEKIIIVNSFFKERQTVEGMFGVIISWTLGYAVFIITSGDLKTYKSMEAKSLHYSLQQGDESKAKTFFWQV